MPRKLTKPKNTNYIEWKIEDVTKWRMERKIHLEDAAYLFYGADPKVRPMQGTIPDAIWEKIKKMRLDLLTCAKKESLYRPENKKNYKTFDWTFGLDFSQSMPQKNDRLKPIYVSRGCIPEVHVDDLRYFFFTVLRKREESLFPFVESEIQAQQTWQITPEVCLDPETQTTPQPTPEKQEEAVKEIIYDKEFQAYYLPSDENTKIQIKPEQTNLLKYLAGKPEHNLHTILRKVYYKSDVSEDGRLLREQRQPFDNDKYQINTAFQPLLGDTKLIVNKRIKTYGLSVKINFS